jgi:hypothetical protein
MKQCDLLKNKFPEQYKQRKTETEKEIEEFKRTKFYRRLLTIGNSHKYLNTSV